VFLQYCVGVFARAGFGEYSSVPMCGMLTVSTASSGSALWMVLVGWSM
jgi:hypothetical protein